SGVTPCALLLGCFAMEASRLVEKVCIECPVSTRPALNAKGIIGPFAVDLPLSFERETLRTMPEAALAASVQLLRLFDGLVFPVFTHGAPVLAFTYQEPLENLYVPTLGLRTTATLNAAPMWARLKLAVRHKGAVLEFRLTGNASEFSALELGRILRSIRGAATSWKAVP